ncbi:MAG: hypothetical protein AB1489_27230 [Acidobacteriota bacterium]
MHNPYRIEGPASISFSGGRTSGYMLYKILEAHNGRLPGDVFVVFANTGKECPQTLDFINECESRWKVKVHWLEWIYVSDILQYWRDQASKKVDGAFQDYQDARRFNRGNEPVIELARQRYKLAEFAFDLINIFHNWKYCPVTFDQQGLINLQYRYREVSYETASRVGEPFTVLIQKKHCLPNVVTRFCTEKLKIETINAFMAAQGFRQRDEVIGLRADEPSLLAKARQWDGERGRYVVLPLAEAGVSKRTVNEFWARQPFDLKLKDYEGNCDCCFQKGVGKLLTIARENPQRLEWWAARESEVTGLARKPTGARWSKNKPTYKQLLQISKAQSNLFPFAIEESEFMDCICHE